MAQFSLTYASWSVDLPVVHDAHGNHSAPLEITIRMLAHEVELSIVDYFGKEVTGPVASVVELVEHGAGSGGSELLQGNAVVHRLSPLSGLRVLLPNGLIDPVTFRNTSWSVHVSVGAFALSHITINDRTIAPEGFTLRDEDWIEMQQSVLEARHGDVCSEHKQEGAQSVEDWPKHRSAGVFSAIGGGDAVSFINFPMLSHAPIFYRVSLAIAVTPKRSVRL
jgi:hypothetical protein